MGVDDFGAKLQAAVFGGGVFDDLHALPRLGEFPVFFARIGDKFAQFLDALLFAEQHLPNQVLGQGAVFDACGEHGTQVVRFERGGQIADGAVFQEFGGKACEWSKQQGFFAVNIARVQMGNGHRRRAHFGFAIHFGVVLGNQFFVAAHEKQAAHGEAADVLAFGDACFLQQVQAATARADEHKIGGVLLQYAVFQAGNRPFLLGGAVDGSYFGVVVESGLLRGKVGEKLAGEFAKIYVGAVFHAGGGDGLVAWAVVHHQRQPLAQGGFVFAVLHIGKQRMLHQRGMAGAQELDVALACYKADVRQALDKVFRLPNVALLCPMRPQLQR